jgi:hypothetical protein
MKGGRAIASVIRPLRHTVSGPAVTYRKKLWPLSDGKIDLDGLNYEMDDQPNSDQLALFAESEDAGQQAVLALAPEARVLVDAGPGTGKTFVACARVASLIGAGIPASKIWLISFTRTAVVEIRNRIASALQDPAAAAAVRVATLDSHAWALHSGFSSDAALTGSFDENISRTLERVRGDEELQDYLHRVRHLIIDEGQDIVGVRAELSLALVDALEQDCGVTVFADEAQAIYGFTEDEDGPGPVGLKLPDELRGRGFSEVALGRVHRTQRPGLVEIFTRVRRRVVRRAGNAAARRRQIEDDIRRLADDTLSSSADIRLDLLPTDALVLMRRRVDVLELSSRNSEVPHRLRMSGLPSCLQPWLGLLLWDHTERRLTKSRFEALWADRAADEPKIDCDVAWRLLVEVAGETATTVDLWALRAALARPTPPMLFCTPEFGTSGPVLGTIHASKGREADEVLLCIPPAEAETEHLDVDEEIRVLFVGATRARQRLTIVGSGYGRAGSASGRAWRWMVAPKGKTHLRRVKIEVGRAQDLEAGGLVGRRVFDSAEEAAGSQDIWRHTPLQQGLIARSERELDYQFILERDGKRLGLLSPSFRDDLREIATQTRKWPPPGFLPFLRSIGARTMVVRPDDPAIDGLYEPWRSSGFLLAPLLTGFSPATFRGDSA